MNKTIRAIYQGGVFHPLEEIHLDEKSEVLITFQSSVGESHVATTDDPIAAISFSSGLGDLSEKFDDYRFGTKQQ